MNIQSPQITTGSQGSKSKQQSFIFQNRPKRVDKFKNPIIKGIHGKMVTFRDQFDTTKPVHDIVIVERIVYPEPKQNKCACACIIQ
ncbi:hypothetical protein pb186bvf_014090 [Paramecium bursaria]